MNNKQNDPEAFRTLQLMSELENEEAVSQRELASRLGVAVGLVNSYLKNLVAKGFLRIKNYPRNRYAYLLTPKGLAEKSRLAYQHLHYFNNLYTVVRQDYLTLFRQLQANGAAAVVFCGVDEVTEIAYLSLQEAGLVLSEVIDVQLDRAEFLGRSVNSLASLDPASALPLVITSLKRAAVLRQALLVQGVAADQIFVPGG